MIYSLDSTRSNFNFRFKFQDNLSVINYVISYLNPRKILLRRDWKSRYIPEIGVTKVGCNGPLPLCHWLLVPHPFGTRHLSYLNFISLIADLSISVHSLFSGCILALKIKLEQFYNIRHKKQNNVILNSKLWPLAFSSLA